MRNVLRRLAVGLGIFALIGFVGGILLNARRVANVKVTLLPGRQEPADIVLPGQKGAAPDYCLQLRADDNWIDCGTFQDTPIGGGLTWSVSEVLPERALVEFRILERDRGLDDMLDQVPFNRASSVEGARYRFETTTEFDLGAGFEWFMAHPIGQVIGVTFGILLAAWLFAHFAL